MATKTYAPGASAYAGGFVPTPSTAPARSTQQAGRQQGPHVTDLGGGGQHPYANPVTAGGFGGVGGGGIPPIPPSALGGGFGGGGASPSGGGGASSLTLNADTNHALEALRGRYDKQLNDLSSNTGHIMDTAGSRIRDAREGGRQALQQDALFANKASDPSLASYDAATVGAQAGAIADIAAGREANLTNALQGGVSVMGAPADLALREKGLQVNAYQAENQAKAATNNMAFQQWLALLNATRTSPIYTG